MLRTTLKSSQNEFEKLCHLTTNVKVFLTFLALGGEPAKSQEKFFVQLVLPTSSLIFPSFQGDPTIFHKGIFIKQTPNMY